LFFASIIIGFSAALLFYKLFGRLGLFTCVAIMVVIANIEVVKCVDIFGIPLTLGNTLYCSISLCTDILNEKFGAKDARKSAWLGFLCLVSLVVFSQTSILFYPNSMDFASDAFKTLFSTTPRLCVASMSCFLLSNILDTYVFSWLKKKCKYLWVRVNISTVISQFLDSMLFTIMAFSFVMPLKDTMILGLTTYFIKVVITMCNTPFVYLGRKIKPLS
jgi:uncharacterized integral membrane protein (TIGR00697 family)